MFKIDRLCIKKRRYHQPDLNSDNNIINTANLGLIISRVFLFIKNK